MKPGEAKGDDAKSPPAEDHPPGSVPRARTYEWTGTGGEPPPPPADPGAPAAPARDPRSMIAEAIARAGLEAEVHTAEPVRAGGTMMLPDADAPPSGPPAVGAGGTMILPGEAEPPPPPPPRQPYPPASSKPADSRSPPPPPPPRPYPPAPSSAPAASRPEPPPPPPRRSSSAEPLSLAPGTRIGQYEIIRELGEGGMGVVCLARDDRLGRRVAIKVLQAGSPDTTSRFIVEARATARCSHENIVVIYEVGEHQGKPFMVLEYLQGQTLTAWLAKSGALSPSRAVEIIVPVVRALACAHEQGIVHRDLKPENIIMTDAGTIKVLDFGIAKVLQQQGGGAPEPDRRGTRIDGAGVNPNPRMTSRGAIMGTMPYMSPEQWGIGVEIDHRTDIWATGIMLFQMLAGKHPLDPKQGLELVVVAMLDEPMPSLREMAPDVPPALADVVDACLKKRVAERLPDAPSLLRALEPFLPGRYVAPRSGQAAVEASPYPGLSAFREENADRFFGRSREIAAMVTQLRERPLMAAVGPSGMGKSSFVRAGVVPALKRSGEGWEVTIVRPGREPMAALARLLSPIIGKATTLEDDLAVQRETAARLVAEPGYLGSALRSSARIAGRNILVFVDQFEELYTLGAPAADRTAFTACLAAAADDATAPVRVVVSVRSDYLGRVGEDPHFMNELAKGLFFLGAPTREGLREALIQPAEMAGYRFEPAVIDEMVQYLEEAPGALPLLQFTASQLWERRDPTRKVLTEKSYRALGGIAGALATHADQVIEKLAPATQALARRLFLRLVTTERTRAIVAIEELADGGGARAELDRLVDQLVQERLLVVQKGGGAAGATVEIVHESLIQTWPSLKRWLDETLEDSAFLEQLRTAARNWQAKGRDAGLLWRGEMVGELERFRRRYRGELPEAQRLFAAAVIDLQARWRRRRRSLATAGAVLGVLAVVGLVAVNLVISAARKEAVANASVARQAEGEAQRRLREVEAKERERQKAQALQKVAEKEAASANTKVALTNEELEKANAELKGTLVIAKEQKALAEEEKSRAEANEWAAKEAKKDALLAADQLKAALLKEKQRADRLKAQLGTLVENLQ